MQLAPNEKTAEPAALGSKAIAIMPDRADKRFILTPEDTRRLNKELGAIIRQWDEDAIDPEHADHDRATLSPDAIVAAIIDTHRHIENLYHEQGKSCIGTVEACNRLDTLTRALAHYAPNRIRIEGPTP